MELWGEELSNTSVVLHLDNCAVVHVINKNFSKDPNLMKLMRRLMVASLKFNIHFYAEHIPGLHNIAPDLLSRLQIQRFKVLYPNMEMKETLSSYRNIVATYRSFIHAQGDTNAIPLPPLLSHLLLYIAH